MSFLDIQFPTEISVGSSGGPAYSTTIVTTRGGLTKRNANWTYPKCEYDVSYGVRKMTDLESLISFFHIVRGMARTFRYKDWSDYKSCAVGSTVAADDQPIGTGDGAETEYQLYKSYTYSGNTRLSRVIDKPVDDTLLVAVNGVTQTEGAGDDYTVDYTTGIITFNAGSIPALGHAVTAGYQFDVHCGFDTDSLSISLDDYSLGSTSVPIVEQKPEA